MKRNYINRTPSSIIGYGTKRQQFQSSDGIFNNEITLFESKTDAMQTRLLYLDGIVTTLQSIADALVVSPPGSGQLVVHDMIVKGGISAPTSNVTEQLNVGTYEVNTSGGQHIFMNSTPLILKNADTFIQGQDAGGIGYGGSGFLEIRGQKGGALSEAPTGGGRKVCLDFGGGGRFRSHLTFQSGSTLCYFNTGDNTARIDFGITFANIPSVTLSHDSSDSQIVITETDLNDYTYDTQNFIQLIEVTTTFIRVKMITYMRRQVGGSKRVKTQPYDGELGETIYNPADIIGYSNVQWAAFDPTNSTFW